MGKNFDQLQKLGLIKQDEDKIPKEYRVVIELLSNEELAVLEKMKDHFDAAAEVGGTKLGGHPLPIVI